MPDLQQVIRLAEKMGERLGAGQVLLGRVQKAARERSLIDPVVESIKNIDQRPKATGR